MPNNNNITKPHSTSDLWLRDALELVPTAGFFVTLEVDMTQGQNTLETLRKTHNIKVTYTHLFVWALARALRANPEFHILANNCKKLYSENVDIGVSVAGDTFVSPILVIKTADQLSLPEIAKTILDETPRVKENQKKWIQSIERWGAFLPFSFLRRLVLKRALNNLHERKRMDGTFKLTCLSEVDTFVPLLFNTAAILGVGKVKERVIAKNGTAVIVPTAIVTCSANHKYWDGARASDLLKKIGSILTSDNLYNEVTKSS